MLMVKKMIFKEEVTLVSQKSEHSAVYEPFASIHLYCESKNWFLVENRNLENLETLIETFSNIEFFRFETKKLPPLIVNKTKNLIISDGVVVKKEGVVTINNSTFCFNSSDEPNDLKRIVIAGDVDELNLIDLIKYYL